MTVVTTGAEAFIDLSRHAKALTSIADWSRVGVRAASYDNLARTITNESKVLRNVLAALEQHPGAFAGAPDATEGARLLNEAHDLLQGTLEPLEGARVMYKDVLGRKVYDASGIAPDLQRAATYVEDGFAALGGRRELPAFETVDEAAARGFDVSTLRAIDDPDPTWALPADHPNVRGRGHKAMQFVLRHAVLGPANLIAGVKVVPGRSLALEGQAIIAPMHGSLLDPGTVAKAYSGAVRPMGNAKLFQGPAAPLLRTIGAFPVKHGNAVEGLATARGILRAGHTIEMFPEAMILRHQEIGSHADGVARLALETNTEVAPLATYGLKPGKYRFEGGRRRLASVAAGERINPNGAAATDRNVALMRERIARSTDDALEVAKQHYDQRRAASLGHKRWIVAGGVAAGVTAGAGLGVKELVD